MAKEKRPGATRDRARQSAPPPRQPHDGLPPSIVQIAGSSDSSTNGEYPGPTISELRLSEAKLRKASELVGLAVYSWDPVNDILDCDDNLRTMWGLSSGEPVDRALILAGIHPDDRPQVDAAITASLNPAGDGRYDIEYRVIGRDDGIERQISTSAQATFEAGIAVGFIGAAVDKSEQRAAEAAILASEARFRAFAEYSANLLWIVDPATGLIEYRSPAYERIWGEPISEAPARVEDWLKRVHPEDQHGVQAAFAALNCGELAIYEYRIVRPDGGVRRLRDTSFSIRNEKGEVTRIGGIAEDLTTYDGNLVYLVAKSAEGSVLLVNMLREARFQVRPFESHAKLLDVAAALAPGCVLLDLREAVQDGIKLVQDLKARAAAFPTVVIGTEGPDPATIVAVMKAGAVDYLIPPCKSDAITAALAAAMAEMHGLSRTQSGAAEAAIRVAHLTPRERDVLEGLVKGGTNKTIAKRLGISPRTVEIYRSQVMNRLDAGSLSELIRIAIAAGLDFQTEAPQRSGPTRKAA